MENHLRGMVLSRFSNISVFAKVMKWDRKKASRIVNHVQKPSATDMERMADCLHIEDPATFVKIFLPETYTMWEEKEAARRNPLNYYRPLI